MPEDNPIVPAPRGDLTTTGGSNPILDKMVKDALELAKASTELSDDARVVFKCPNLEKVVREALDKPEGEITRGDLQGLEKLEYHGWDDDKVSDLSGLEHALNLTELMLVGNHITDLSSLQGLTNLTHLSLNRNLIPDLSPLQGLTNLAKLDLYNNQLTNISPLQGLTNLRHLTLHQNQITDLSPLQELTNLTTLWLTDNQISQSQKDDLQRSLPNCYIYARG